MIIALIIIGLLWSILVGLGFTILTWIWFGYLSFEFDFSFDDISHIS